MTVKKIRMLMLEDNPGDLDLVREMLSEIPHIRFDLEHVDRVAAAENRLGTETFDIVLIDLSLPDSHGLPTFERISSCASHLPIVILSSLNDEDMALEAVRKGAQDYLVKGQITSQQLSRVILYAIERHEVKMMKKEFISMVNHEIRSPFTSVYLALQVLRNKTRDFSTEESNKLLETAYDNCVVLVKLIDNILDADRMEAGTMDFKPVPMNLAAFAEKAVETNRILGRQYSVEFEMKQGPEHALVSADPDRLQQVMTNLLSNASKFSPSGATVTVSVARHSGVFRVSVTNHGPAIPPEYQNKIFQKFVRYSPSNDKRYKGSGLGLAICKYIMDTSGGKIDFMTIPGQGTTFYFELPELKPENIGKKEEETATA